MQLITEQRPDSICDKLMNRWIERSKKLESKANNKKPNAKLRN
jgi:hypothetical protein